MTLSVSRHHVIDVATRFQAARIVQVAVATGLADVLNGETVTVEETATALGWELSRTRHLLDALCALDLAFEARDGYTATAAGSLMSSHHPTTAAPMILHEHLQQALWANLPAVLATDGVHAGQQDRTMLDESGRLATLLDAMLAIDRELPSQLAGRPGWDRVHRIADVAGGHGAVLASIASRHGHITGVVLDQPPAGDVARRTFATMGVEDRCRFGTTNLRSSPPLPGDLDVDCILAVRCLHNFDAATIRRFLEASRALLAPAGMLMVVDVHLDWSGGFATPSSAAVFGAYLAINCAGGWLPPVDWWERELSNLGGSYSGERCGPYDVHEVTW
jgi:SAM-dependent methyltransferase